MFQPSLGHPQALKDYIYVLQEHIVGSQTLTECYRGTVYIVRYMRL